MSKKDYNDGREKGRSDVKEGKQSTAKSLSGIGGHLVDTILGYSKEEKDWRSGYTKGYEEGKKK